VSPPKELLSRSLDTPQRRQIQFQENSLFAGRMFEVLDGRLSPLFIPGGEVHFGVLGQYRLLPVRCVR